MPNTISPFTPSPSQIVPLSAQERSALRAAAHALRPVVLIGERGLSESVLKEIDRALGAHQLIKVRAASQERDARAAMLADICTKLACHPVHHLGKMLILYRPASAGEIAPAPRTRKASEPYVPKKQAAVARPTNKPTSKKPSKMATKAPSRRMVANSKLLNDKPRTGSALSLRAGARRVSRTIGARKSPRSTTPRSR